jgi:hypothetical protein
MNIDAAPFIDTLSKLVESCPSDVTLIAVVIAPVGSAPRPLDSKPDYFLRRVPKGVVAPESFVVLPGYGPEEIPPEIEMDASRADTNMEAMIQRLVSILRCTKEGALFAFVPHTEIPFANPKAWAQHVQPRLFSIGAKKAPGLDDNEWFRLTWHDQEASQYMPSTF